jgi:predicted CoA-binding protein
MRSIERLLEESVTIAVVGASTDPRKAAHRVPVALQRMGFRVIPVNPRAATLFGVTAYPDLASIPERIDLVDIFRPGPDTPPIVQAAIDIGAGGVWLQLGITSPESRALAEAAGIDYVEDRCLMVDAQRLGIDKREHE